MPIKIRLVTLAVACLFSFACGNAKETSPRLTVAGTVTTGDREGPVVVALTRDGDMQRLITSGQGVDALVTAQEDGRFTMDLSKSSLRPGDTVYLSAFIPSNANAPFRPAKGDPMGICTDPATHFPEIVLNADGRHDLTIAINRTMNNVTTPISGRVTTPEEGQLILVVHHGEFASPDITAFDPVNIIGYHRLAATPPETPFAFALLPFAPEPPLTEVTLVAILDRNGNGIADAGDRVGWHQPPGALSAGFSVDPSGVTGLTLTPDRTLHDGTCRITGTLGASAFPVTVVAHMGELSSPAVDAIDPSRLIGMTRVAPGQTAFSMTVPALGAPFPFDPVYLIAVEDRDGNNRVSPGDRIGFSTGADNAPHPLRLEQGATLTDQTLTFSVTVPRPTGPQATIEGELILADLSPDQTPWLVVVRGDDPAHLLSDALGSLVWFEQLAPDATRFSLALSQTDLEVGDTIMVAGVLKRESGGFAFPVAGDAAGIAIPNGSLSAALTVRATSITGLSLHITREVRDYKARLSGTIRDFIIANKGLLTLIVYPEEISDPTDLDMNKVMGYTRLTKTSGSAGFAVDILPLGDAPPLPVWVYAWVDRNGNGTINSGDAVGVSSSVTIEDGLDKEGVDIVLFRRL